YSYTVTRHTRRTGTAYRCSRPSCVPRYCTITSKFMPWWMVQYTWNVPAVLNGPIGVLSLPLNVNLTVGAPASWAGFCVVPSQLPFTTICGDELSSTILTDSP